MNEEPPNPFDTVGDEPVEARIVAWVLGEASAFEAAELERLCEERPELLVFRRRMRALHGLLTEAEAAEPNESWKLSPEKRKVLDEIFGEQPVVPADLQKEKQVTFNARRTLLAVAACLIVSAIVMGLSAPMVISQRKRAHGVTHVDFMRDRSGIGDPSEYSERVAKAKMSRLTTKNQDEELLPSAPAETKSESASAAPTAASAPPGKSEVAYNFDASNRAFSKPGGKEVARQNQIAQHQFARQPRPRIFAEGVQSTPEIDVPAAMPELSARASSLEIAKQSQLAHQPARSDVALESAAITSPQGEVDAPAAIADLSSLADSRSGLAKDSKGGFGGGFKAPPAQPAQSAAVDSLAELRDRFISRSRAKSDVKPAAAAALPPVSRPLAGSGEAGAVDDSISPGYGNSVADLPYHSNQSTEHGATYGLGSEDPAITRNSIDAFAKSQKLPEIAMAGGKGNKTPTTSMPFGMAANGSRKLESGAEVDPAAASKSPSTVGDSGAMNSEPLIPKLKPASPKSDEAVALDSLGVRSLTAADGSELGRAATNGKTDLNGNISNEDRDEINRSVNSRDSANKLSDKIKELPVEESTKQDLSNLDKSEPLFKEAKTKDSAKPFTELMEEIPASEDPYSTFSLNVSDASFQLAKAALAKGERPAPADIKPEQFYNAVDYGDPAPVAGQPVAATIEQCAHPIIPGRNLVRVALRVGSTGHSAAQPLRLTLLVDQSGSMVREDRRAAMDHALTQLKVLLTKNDRVTVIGFSRTPHLLADGLTGDDAGKLTDLANQTASEGGTNLEEAMKLGAEKAMAHRVEGAQNRIVLFTDGAANLGDANPDRLAAQVKSLRQQGIAFDVAGIGADGLNDRLLSELARNGNGRYYVVGDEKDDSFARQLAGAFRPAAENVKVQVIFNPQRVGRYKLIGFEKDRLKTEDFRNDAVDAAELAADEAGVAIYQVEPLPGGSGELGEVSVRFRDTAGSGEMVERSWTMSYDEQAVAFDRATPSMQLAGLSMLAAQKLSGGPLGAAIDFKQLSGSAAFVKQFYGNSPRVGDMLRVIDELK